MVNYSWGDKWDERQRREDERRYYGPNGGSYSGGSGGGYAGGGGHTSYPRRGSHTGRIIAIVLVALIATGGIVYVFNPLDVKGMIFKSENTPENADNSKLAYISKTAEQELIKERITMDAESYRTYTFKPAQAVETYIVGDLNVQYGDPIKLDLLDGNGACVECGKEFGSKISVNYTLQGGSEYTLRFDNSENDITSLINVQLSIMYKDPLYELQTTKVSVQTSDYGTKIVPAGNDQDEVIPPVTSPIDTTAVSSETLQDYREYALLLINEDRKDFGLEPVELSDNEAAQVHAEDILTTNQLSHWMSNGMKPHMIYTQYGGLGNVGQNAAWAGYTDSQVMSCNSPWTICDTIDVRKEIKSAQYGMMYDDAASDWGHRDNILDPHHTHVSIGVAADKYGFAMIQNFEANYLAFDKPITTDNRHVTLAGGIPSSADIFGISIFYDDLPTTEVYEEHKDDGFYDMGRDIAGVAPPSYYYDDTVNISASQWSETSNSFNIQFDLQAAIRMYEDGVYTVVVWLDQNGDTFPVTSYSIIVDDLPQTEDETLDNQEQSELPTQQDGNNESSSDHGNLVLEDVLELINADRERYGLSPVENDYFTSLNEEPIKNTNSGYILDLVGQIQDKDLTPWGIDVYYDGFPDPEIYERNKNSDYYSAGNYVACVTPRAISWYCPDENGDPLPKAEMDTWGTSDSKASQTITIRGSIDNLIDEPGVYTLFLFLVTNTDANNYYSCTNRIDNDGCDIDAFPVLTLNIVKIQ